MQIKESIHQTLEQLTDLISQLSEEDFKKSISIIHYQSIGKHVRHIIEFYQCLIFADNYICYDERNRDELIENSIIYAQNCIEEIKSAISLLNLNTIITIKQLINQEEMVLNTTLGRELLYCIDHSIHHFAIIKIAIENEFPQYQFQKGFGIAYSTLQYQNEN